MISYQLLVPISQQSTGLCLYEVSFGAPAVPEKFDFSPLANQNLGSKNWPLIRTMLGDGMMMVT